MDCISIKNLEVFSRNGAFGEENRVGQKFAIDAKLYIDTRVAGVSDDLSKSVDYAKVCHFISWFMKGHNFKLIETAAERLAEDILIEYPAITSVSLETKKPWAPIGLPLEEVSVTIERGWHRVFIALGANMGDREGNINKAIELLGENDRIMLLNRSKLIETEPYGNPNQEMYINGVVELRTLHTPSELLVFCKNLERMAGRTEGEHWGPRPLDLDILFYDDDIIDLPNLTVPHVDIKNRSFVLEPMCDIAPYFRHPLYKKTMREMLDELSQ